ncbi:MAG: hypothetical protein NTZ05_00070, partial [Chloroflexi bacterium]|nr:hypothetical protein [Chloroflexota bacterium]
PTLAHALLAGAAAGAGYAIGSKGVDQATKRLAALNPPPVAQNPSPRRGGRRNPIEQGELVNIPKLQTSGTVIDVQKSGGGILSGPETKYLVEYQLDGRTKRSLIPERGVVRLNPLSEGQTVDVPSLHPTFRIAKVINKKGKGWFGGGSTSYDVEVTYPGAGTTRRVLPANEVRRHNPAPPSARDACPDCGVTLRPARNVAEMRCPNCDALLKVGK